MHFKGLRTFMASAALAVTLAAPAIARADTLSIDAASLVDYTGTGWSMSVPPGWAPVDKGIIGGPLPNGGSAVVIVGSTDNARGAGLEIVGPAAISGILKDPTTKQTGQKGGRVDGQAAQITDFTTTLDGGKPAVARTAVWLEYKKVWFAVYLSPTADAGAGGLDMFSNQLLPTMEIDDPDDN
jgi:hypothetical protein